MTPISQKAHDISYAVFRVATLVKNHKLRVELEDAAIDLVSHYENITHPAIDGHTANVIDRLERLVSLAESVGEMKPVNAGVLRRELNNLQTAIRIEVENSNGKPEEIDLNKTFPLSGNTITSPLQTKSAGFEAGRPTSQPVSVPLHNNLPAISENHLPAVIQNSFTSQEETRGNAPSEEPGLTIRQTAIMRYIREIALCRLRNIVEAMPNVSERTIRNDLQVLIEKGLVRRVGGGGPNSYFESMEMTLSTREQSLPAKTF